MKLKTLIISIILLVGVWHVSAAGYMLSKAWLSHYLIKLAWQETVMDKQAHKPWSWADTYPVAKLQVPRLKKSSYILEGSSGRNLAFSATHLAQSGMPGQQKTIVISGHKDSHFEYLQELTLGDKIVLNTIQHNRAITSSYIVYQIKVVDSNTHNLNILNREELLLTTCYPFNILTTAGNMRYVVYAQPMAQISG